MRGDRIQDFSRSYWHSLPARVALLKTGLSPRTSGWTSHPQSPEGVHFMFVTWPSHRPNRPFPSPCRRGRPRPFCPALELLESRTLLAGGIFLVTNTDDSGDGSLRQALFDSAESQTP